MLDADARQFRPIYNQKVAKNHRNTGWNRGRIATGRRERMKQSRFDFAIVGASPLARLLAGLLSSAHGKTVLLQGQNQGVLRLARRLDLSVAAITRPETWALLNSCVPQATRLITRIGKRAAFARVDPILFADLPAGQQALGHMRHMAAAHGLAAERAALGAGRDGVILRDAVMLLRPVLDPALELWLAETGVRHLPADAALTIQADGRACCDLDGEALEIGQTILADDDAIMAHLADELWPALLQRQKASAILTPPTKQLAAPVMGELDSGLTLHQHADGGLAAYGAGDIVDLARALGAFLGKPDAFEQAGQAHYVQLVTRDGAPALGRAAGTGPDVLAGFGSIGAFLAPAIARWLCGEASDAENDWFAARLVNRNGDDGIVSDIGERP